MLKSLKNNLFALTALFTAAAVSGANAAQTVALQWDRQTTDATGNPYPAGDIKQYDFYMVPSANVVTNFNNSGGVTSIPGLMAWFDASQSAPSGNVWTNLFNGGANAVWSGSSTPATGSIKGHKAVSFDGQAGSMFTVPALAGHLAQTDGCTVFIVASVPVAGTPDPTTASGINTVLGWGPYASGARGKIGIEQPSANLQQIYSMSNGVGSPSNAVTITTQNCIIVQRIMPGDPTTSGAVKMMNGLEVASSAAHGNTAQVDPSPNNDTLEIGGDVGSTARGFNGLIGEVVVYKGALTDAQINTVTAALSQRWDIPVSRYVGSTAEPHDDSTVLRTGQISVPPDFAGGQNVRVYARTEAVGGTQQDIKGAFVSDKSNYTYPDLVTN
jgi:hypothetical protein